MRVKSRVWAPWGLVLFVAAAAGAADPTLGSAVRTGDHELLRTLLRKGVDVNVPEPDGATALHWAAHRDDLESADLLLRAGARPNSATDHGMTPLFLAAQNGSGAMVEKLLKAGADANHTALPNKVTPLMVAAKSGNVRAVKTLLAHGADPRAKETARDQTALMWAVAQQHAAVAQVLIEVGSDLNARSRSSNVLVSRGRSDDKTAPLRQHLVEVAEGGYTPLLFAARNGHVETARVLLGAGANVNELAPSGASALVIAAHSGHSDLGRLLVEKGADPNSDKAGYSALHAAILRGDEPLVKALLGRGANVNAVLKSGTTTKRFHKEWAFNEGWVGATPMFLAAKFAEANIMRLLAAAGADTKFQAKDGTTVLMAAAGMGTPGIGLDNTGSDRHGRSLDPAEIEIALAHDEDTRTIMPSGIEAVKLAIKLGADVNAVSATGETAMHSAAFHGFETVIEVLVKNGARLDVKNKEGHSPLAVAVEQKRISTAELLRTLGAS